jgi:excisionase family DNA binding protein
MDTKSNIVVSDIDKLSGIPYHSTGRNRTEEMSADAILDRLLTIQEICELLKVPKSYVYWLTHQKKIPHIKMQGHLRFRESAIHHWLESQEVC